MNSTFESKDCVAPVSRDCILTGRKSVHSTDMWPRRAPLWLSKNRIDSVSSTLPGKMQRKLKSFERKNLPSIDSFLLLRTFGTEKLIPCWNDNTRATILINQTDRNWRTKSPRFMPSTFPFPNTAIHLRHYFGHIVPLVP